MSAEGVEAESLRTRLVNLAVAWQDEADDDERYLNSGKAYYTECQELPAVITRSREHIRDLRALLEDFGGGAS